MRKNLLMTAKVNDRIKKLSRKKSSNQF